jgi:hypothetical protein
MLKIKCVDSRVNVNILASMSVPFTLTTVQVPNLALTHPRWITVWRGKDKATDKGQLLEQETEEQLPGQQRTKLKARTVVT